MKSVVAVPAVYTVVALAGIHPVIAVPAVETVVTGVAEADEPVISRTAVETVGVAEAEERVVAGPTDERGVSAAFQRVVARTAGDVEVLDIGELDEKVARCAPREPNPGRVPPPQGTL